jgi:multiple sugar transport system substrate-binding protein
MQRVSRTMLLTAERIEAMATTISRRRFLKTTALAAGAAAGAGGLLEATQPPPTEAAHERDTTTLTVMYSTGELSVAEVKKFEALNPGIKVRQLAYDDLRFAAMMSAGTAPDFVRSYGAPQVPNLAARGLCTDLTPYFQNSTVLKTSNLEAINNVYRWDGKVQGQGPRYGFVKDWSQDNTLWVNKKLFDKAGIKYPSTNEPMTYDELLALGKKLTVRKNGKIAVYGLSIFWGAPWMQGRFIQMLQEDGKSLWSPDFSQADFTSPEILKILKWHVDWAQAQVGFSELNPDASWEGPLFIANRLAVLLSGYWFQGELATDPTHKSLQSALFGPSPQWGAKRISACYAGVGAIIPYNAKNKEAAWKFMEYFEAGVPAVDRATSGWGIPPLKSNIKLMPSALPPQKEILASLNNELKYLGILRYSPYVDSLAMENAIHKYMLPVIKGQQKLADGAKALEAAVNKLIGQGKQQVGA